MDVFSQKQRSKVMAAIKGQGAKSTEIAMRRLLRRHGISGWRSHVNSLPGKPDFAFPRKRVAVFVDGCFWHGCLQCSRNLKPSTNKIFWTQKIQANRKRDRKVSRLLRLQGWKVLRVWEHRLKNNFSLPMAMSNVLL